MYVLYITIKIQISDYNYVAKINGGSRLKTLTTILVIREERCTCFSDIQKYRHYVLQLSTCESILGVL